MADKIKLHPVTPHQKRIFEIADQLRSGATLLFPTDTQYALGCDYENKKGIEAIRQIKGIDETHLLTLICDSLSGLSKFAVIDDLPFKVIKKIIPAPVTFVLPATREVPRLLQHPKRNTVGFRVPDYPIVQRLVEELGRPIIATTAKSMNGVDPGSFFREDLISEFDRRVDVIIDNQQDMNFSESTIVDFSHEEPQIQRRGLAIEKVEEVFAYFNLTTG
jgi:tRNA threonylcarbamoyl adenosine modification protein (Sua5/YciO/YrdC/YwlC family)